MSKLNSRDEAGGGWLVKIDNQHHFSKARKKDVALSSVFDRVFTHLALDNSLLDFFYLYFTEAFDFE